MRDDDVWSTDFKLYFWKVYIRILVQNNPLSLIPLMTLSPSPPFTTVSRASVIFTVVVSDTPLHAIVI